MINFKPQNKPRRTTQIEWGLQTENFANGYQKAWVKFINLNYVFNYGKSIWFLNSYLFTIVKVTKKAVSELGRYLFFYLNPNI